MSSDVAAVAAALGSAFGYAAGSVMQQRACRGQPAGGGRALMAAVVRNPLWVGGFGADSLAYALQFVALGAGTLVLVQPLLISSLLLALGLGAAVDRRRISPSEWTAVAAVAVGLCALLVSANPRPGLPDPSPLAWVGCAVAATAAVAALRRIAGRSTAGGRAMSLGAAAGIANAAVAALSKSCAHLLALGTATAAGAWQPYALGVTAVASTVLTQRAFQAGPLVASLPMLTIVDPIVSLGLGVALFHEHVSTSATTAIIGVLAVCAIAWGVWMLAGSPRLNESVGSS